MTKYIKEWHFDCTGIVSVLSESVEQLAKMGTPPKAATYNIDSLKMTYSTVRGVNDNEVPRGKDKDTRPRTPKV